MRKFVPVIVALLALGAVVAFEVAERHAAPPERATATAAIAPARLAAPPPPAAAPAPATAANGSDLPTIDVPERAYHAVPEGVPATMITPR